MDQVKNTSDYYTSLRSGPGLSHSHSHSLSVTHVDTQTLASSLFLSHSLSHVHTLPPTLSLSLPPDPLDIDDGLYNFLSPQLVSHGESGVDLKGDENSLLRPHINGVMLPDKPEWFQKGKCTSILLEFILLSCVVLSCIVLYRLINLASSIHNIPSFASTLSYIILH